MLNLIYVFKCDMLSLISIKERPSESVLEMPSFYQDRLGTKMGEAALENRDACFSQDREAIAMVAGACGAPFAAPARRRVEGRALSESNLDPF